MAYDAGLSAFSIFSEDYSLLGLRGIALSAFLTNYQTAATTVTLYSDILVIDPCIDSFVFTVPVQPVPVPYFYTLNSPKLIFETVEFVTDPAICAANTTYSCEIIAGSRNDLCTVSDGLTIGSFDETNG